MTTLLVLLQQLLSSGTHIVAKGLTNTIPPELLLLLRSSIAASLYLTWMLIKRKSLRKIKRKDIGIILILSAINIPINQYLFFRSMKLTTAPNVALAYAMTPLFVLMIEIFIYKLKPTKLKIAGIFVALAGTSIILFEKGFNFSADGILGDLLALTASLSWAFYTFYGRNVSIKYGAIFTTGLTMICGWAMFLPIFLLSGVKADVSGFTTVNWLQIFYVGAITSGAAYAIWYYVLTKTEASKVAVFNNLQPAITAVLAAIFFGTPITLPFLLGGTFVVGGVFLTQKG